MSLFPKDDKEGQGWGDGLSQNEKKFNEHALPLIIEAGLKFEIENGTKVQRIIYPIRFETQKFSSEITPWRVKTYVVEKATKPPIPTPRMNMDFSMPNKKHNDQKFIEQSIDEFSRKNVWFWVATETGKNMIMPFSDVPKEYFVTTWRFDKKLMDRVYVSAEFFRNEIRGAYMGHDETIKTIKEIANKFYPPTL